MSALFNPIDIMSFCLVKIELAEVLHDFVDNEAIGTVFRRAVCRDRDVNFTPHYMQIIIHPGALGPSFDPRYFSIGILVIYLVLDCLIDDLLDQVYELTILDLGDGDECFIWCKYQIRRLLLLIKGKVFVERPAWVLI